MNIFVLDRDPEVAASYMCDSHVVKMIVESCQLLSTHDRFAEKLPVTDDRYKITHQNHPCSRCLASHWNRYWLAMHLDALLEEYTKRFGKIHKCEALYHRYWSHMYQVYPVEREATILNTSLPKCVPAKFRIKGDAIEDVVASYRQYYIYKAETMPRFAYTKTKMPKWLTERNTKC